MLTYNSAIENVFPIFYVALHDRLFSWNFVGDFFIFFLFSMFSTSYGYLINDLSDRDLDRAHGKANTFENDSLSKATLVVLFFLLLSLAFASNFWGKQGFCALWFGWFFITTFYSLKPIRLKERGKIGLAFVVIAQRVLPTLIVFAAFSHWDVITVIVFTLYMLFRGLSSDINHQLEDYQRDVVTSTGTYAVKSGFERTFKLFHTSLKIEKVLLFFCLLLIFIKLISDRVFVLPLLVIYVILVVAGWFQMMGTSGNTDINPFISGRKDLFQFLHHGFPSVALPLYLLLILVTKNWIFVFILAFFIVYRKLYSMELLAGSFPVRIVRKVLGNLH